MDREEEKAFMRRLRNAWVAGSRSKEGATCPCCERFGKVYSRSISGTIAHSLLWLFEYSRTNGKDAWADMRNDAPLTSIRGNEYTKLLHWGLVEKMPVGTGTKKNSGMYRITRTGIDFVKGHISVPKILFIYNDVVLSTSDEMVEFASCLNAPFDYQEMMGQGPEDSL